VYYDLSNEQSPSFITMAASINDGLNWQFSCTQTTGDIGNNITNGTGKHILWNFGLEHPDYYSPQAIIKIIVSDTEADLITDIDGNIYAIVSIGDQMWMAENLRVTHYRNGDPIPTGYSNGAWSSLDDDETGAYAVYNDDPNVYGTLYNWYAVNDERDIAPAGWHIPTDEEWDILVEHLLGSNIAGGKVKECTGGSCPESEYWYSPNTGATNESGFTALPGGYRNGSGNYGSMGASGYFWSSTEYSSSTAWFRLLYYSNSSVYRSYYSKRYGFSIRCVRD
jgi:uncharacterized protein (TIGR02145 family)